MDPRPPAPPERPRDTAPAPPPPRPRPPPAPRGTPVFRRVTHGAGRVSRRRHFRAPPCPRPARRRVEPVGGGSGRASRGSRGRAPPGGVGRGRAGPAPGPRPPRRHGAQLRAPPVSGAAGRQEARQVREGPRARPGFQRRPRLPRARVLSPVSRAGLSSARSSPRGAARLGRGGRGGAAAVSSGRPAPRSEPRGRAGAGVCPGRARPHGARGKCGAFLAARGSPLPRTRVGASIAGPAPGLPVAAPAAVRLLLSAPPSFWFCPRVAVTRRCIKRLAAEHMAACSVAVGPAGRVSDPVPKYKARTQCASCLSAGQRLQSTCVSAEL